MKKKLLLFLFLFPSTMMVLAQSGKVSASVSTNIATDSMWIGDQTVLQIDIEKDISVEVGLPQFKDNKMTDKIEILGLPTIDTLSLNDRTVKLRINYTITSFDAGSYTLQGFPLVLDKMDGSVPDTLFTPTVNRLFVKTFAIDTTKQDIFDIKLPIDTPLLFAEIKDLVLIGGIALILLTVALYFLLRHLKSRRLRKATKPKEPAHIIAIRALIALHHKKMWQSGNVKDYYSLLSDILRTYLENRYQIGAMEMTTPEIMVALKSINISKQQDELKDVFMLSDLVKFAKWTPSPIDNEEAYQTIYNYVEETKQIIIENEN